VDLPPKPVVESSLRSRPDHEREQVERDRTEPEPHRAAETNGTTGRRGDWRIAVEHRGDDMHDDEDERQQRQVSMDGAQGEAQRCASETSSICWRRSTSQQQRDDAVPRVRYQNVLALPRPRSRGHLIAGQPPTS
jgi:hypothetical protein